MAKTILPGPRMPVRVERRTFPVRHDLTNKARELLFPNPGALLGWQPALDGPPLPFFCMDISGPTGTGGGPKITKTGIKEELLSFFKTRSQGISLFNLEKALKIQEELGLDLATRVMGIEFLIAWGALPDTIAAFILAPAELSFASEKVDDNVINLINRRKNLDHFRLFPDFDLKQGSKYTKMLMAREENMDVLLLKTADLFTELSRVEGPHPSAHIALEAFSPLLKILGFSDHARELEDLAFLSIRPEEYRLTESQTFDAHRVSRSFLIEELRTLADRLSSDLSIEHRLSRRPKGILSIHEKDREVNDIFGIRVVVRTETDCYLAQQEIISIMEKQGFTRVLGKCDDHIAKKKPSGYQALHETFEGRTLAGGKWRVEIQIKSEVMDHESEIGSYSHLRYKLGRRGFDDITLEGADARDRYTDNRENLIKDGMVFGYDADGGLHKIGPVTEIWKKPTVLDFAFHCSRDLGNRCVGADIQRLDASGNWSTIHANFSTPIENGDLVVLRIANEPQPITENRLKAGTTELAAASLGLLKQGREVDSNRGFDELKEEGNYVFSRAVVELEKGVVGSFRSFFGYPRETHFRFSLERIFKKFGFENPGIFYTAIGLKGEKREDFIREVTQMIKESSLVIGFDPGEVEKGSASIYLLVNNAPGVMIRLLQYFKRFGLRLSGFSVRSKDGFSLLKMRVAFKDRNHFDSFFRRIENLYKDIPLVTTLPLKTPVKIETKLEEERLQAFFEDILGLGGNVLQAEAHTATFSKKLVLEFGKVCFPIAVNLERVEAKLKKKGYKVTLSRG